MFTESRSNHTDSDIKAAAAGERVSYCARAQQLDTIPALTRLLVSLSVRVLSVSVPLEAGSVVVVAVFFFNPFLFLHDFCFL